MLVFYVTDGMILAHLKQGGLFDMLGTSPVCIILRPNKLKKGGGSQWNSE
jgi:hypothetical protein